MYKTILVPLDGSKRAEAILPHVENMATCYEAKIIFLQIVQPLDNYQRGTAPDYHYQIAYERNNKDAESYLSQCVHKFREKGIDAKKWIEHGPIVETIIKVAENINVGLIAIASHGRTGLARVFYGSVASGLLHSIDRPLLLIRSRNYE